jgi:hypothetical protein
MNERNGKTGQVFPNDRAPTLRSLIQDQGGAAAVFFAGSLFMLLGMAAIAVDLSYLYSLRGKLQNTADAAVLASADELPDPDTVQSIALTYGPKNMAASEHGTVIANDGVETGKWDFRGRTFTANDTPLNAVRVTAGRSVDNGNAVSLFFGQALGFASSDVVTQAVGAQLIISVPCLLALDETASAAAKVNNGTVKVDGCGFHSNSKAPDAIDIALNGTLEADSICANGGVTGNGTSDPGPQTGCPQIDDPLADLVPPPVGGCDYSGNDAKFSNGEHTLTPGVYCGGISLSGGAVVHFEPGTYIINGGSMKVTGNTASMEGEQVSFYFTGDSVLDLAGQGDIDLSASTEDDDPLKGILFFGDPDSDPDIKHGISGSSNMTYDGTMYFPANEFNFTGNGTGSSSAGYTLAIARLLKFSGNGSLNFKWPEAGMSDVPLPELLEDLEGYTKPILVN